MSYAFAFCSPSACSRPSLNIHVFVVYVSGKLSVKQDLFIVNLVFVVCSIASPAGAVAKYCDEYVCLSVCLSVRISLEPHARSLPIFLCMLPVSMARSSSDTFTIGRIAYRREGVSFPIENVFLVGKGGWECTARAKYAIYDCLVLSLNSTVAFLLQYHRNAAHFHPHRHYCTTSPILRTCYHRPDYCRV